MLILLAFYCQFNFFSRSTKDLRSLLRHFGFFFFRLGVEQGFLWGRLLLSWCSKYSHAGIKFLFSIHDGQASAAASSFRLHSSWHPVNCFSR